MISRPWQCISEWFVADEGIYMKQNLIALAMLGVTASGYSSMVNVPLHLISSDGNERNIGKITISETIYGLQFTPQLNQLSAGIHGFHVHENGSCEPALKDGKLVAGLAAGGHFDPENTGKHGGPWNPDSHLGDLPALYITQDGKAEQPVLAPRLTKLSQIQGLALMIHTNGDNYQDHPQPLGGGGARIACGIIP